MHIMYMSNAQCIMQGVYCTTYVVCVHVHVDMHAGMRVCVCVHAHFAILNSCIHRNNCMNQVTCACRYAHETTYICSHLGIYVCTTHPYFEHGGNTSIS